MKTAVQSRFNWSPGCPNIPDPHLKNYMILTTESMASSLQKTRIWHHDNLHYVITIVYIVLHFVALHCIALHYCSENLDKQNSPNAIPRPFHGIWPIQLLLFVTLKFSILIIELCKMSMKFYHFSMIYSCKY